MAGNAAKAYQAVASDPALLERLRSASSPADKRQVLADAGHTGFTSDQAEVFRSKQQGAELSDDDLQRIAGGGTTTAARISVIVTEDACEDVAEAFA